LAHRRAHAEAQATAAKQQLGDERQEAAIDDGG
jgi:hypothetical protein